MVLSVFSSKPLDLISSNAERKYNVIKDKIQFLKFVINICTISRNHIVFFSIKVILSSKASKFFIILKAIYILRISEINGNLWHHICKISFNICLIWSLILTTSYFYLLMTILGIIILVIIQKIYIAFSFPILLLLW